MKKNSDAKIKAVKKYDEKTYDRFTIRLPKGEKEKIQATGQSLNSYIVEAVKEKMERDSRVE